jgi:hypothetical protein
MGASAWRECSAGHSFIQIRASFATMWIRMPPMGEYDTAQICLNGHMINDTATKYPLQNSPFCSKCGSETIMACRNCQTRIYGAYVGDGALTGLHSAPVPAFCRACGKAFPWTATRIEAARMLADETDLSSDDREQLKSTLLDLVRDSPQTTLATTRYKKLMLKAGKETARAFRDILVDIASETAKKAIWG